MLSVRQTYPGLKHSEKKVNTNRLYQEMEKSV